jgi:hypothetical protein
MVGFVIGCLSPNSASTSNDNHNILLVKIDDDFCIPISEKGVKEYKAITSPPSRAQQQQQQQQQQSQAAAAVVASTSITPKNDAEQEQESKEKDEQVTL